MRRNERFGLVLTEQEKVVMQHMAEAEGVPIAVVVRRLIRAEATERGLFQPTLALDEVPMPEVQDA